MVPEGFQPVFFDATSEGNATVVTLRGPRLSEEDNIEQFGQELATLVDHPSVTQVVLNLERLLLITSAALGKMITLHRRLHRKAGRLVLCHPTGMVDDVLRASRLSDYFHICDNLPAALVAIRS